MSGIANVIFPGGGGGGGAPIVVVASPSTLTWILTDSGFVSDGQGMAAASGGSGSYSYFWLSDRPDAGSIGSGAAVFFASSSGITANFFCQAVDAVTGATGNSNNITVSM